VRVFGKTIRSRQPLSRDGREASIVLRPEALSLEDAGKEGVRAHVLTLAFTGPVARFTVAVENGTVVMVDVPNPDHFYEEGTEVSLQLPDEVPALLE
jgi:ABC-type Fe3+/spermidine/putrescine transport system ATPase subunit